VVVPFRRYRIEMGTDSRVWGNPGRWRSYFERVGAIAPGKAVDFRVLDANPLTDIRNMRQIESVWIAGR
jgi:imidazolonepropionase-like amidohydrolase